MRRWPQFLAENRFTPDLKLPLKLFVAHHFPEPTAKGKRAGLPRIWPKRVGAMLRIGPRDSTLSAENDG
ncbi:hypothetical protein F9K85_11795 [Brucella tritici]|uniref:Uncharacterized protein n=1 Tax=Brucella tritici TaxID=94626 RepID=A0A833FPC5_9HYPH|nr:hypothetical protein F9K91_13740 [Brucella tritici]KAB2676119.1 hypothetical protein F9K85_11795 [Brucella tritici]